MRLGARLTVATVLAWSLACGGDFVMESGEFGDFDDLGALGDLGDLATVSSPWSEMGLPTDSGSVLYRDSTTLSVQHDGAVTDVADSYKAAFASAGWEVENDMALADTVSVTYKKGEERIVLAVANAGGTVMVSASTLDF